MKHGRLADLAGTLKRCEQLGYDEAWSMPRSYYTDPAVLRLERERLFGREWICIGRVEEIANPGDYMTFQLCDEPLIAVRGRDDVVRVLSNVCRHRGTVLEQGRGNRPRLVCPYHNWSYDLDGRLVGAPRMDAHATFDKASCRLPEFPVEEWHGFLFTNLMENPPPLATRLEALERMIRNYHMEEMKLRYLKEEVWTTNWKCMIENFMEGYHLSPLHRTTLHLVNPTRLCRHYPAGEAYFGYNAGYVPELPRSTKGHPDLTEAEVHNCVMFAVPPGLVSGCGGDYSSFICVQPESIDRVRVKMGLIFYGDHWTDEVVRAAITLFEDTMAEDKVALASVMCGMASSRHQAGPLAPADFEGPVLDFYRYCGRRIGDALANVE
ncbi:MAG: aromatic ring-hydroxylating dioxygenase subunit alpha [Rhodospirillales bacterium]|nr:aromatic ring-hydroxylating dioxygenase subunit alpha [Rhodospirillales bacterium]